MRLPERHYWDVVRQDGPQEIASLHSRNMRVNPPYYVRVTREKKKYTKGRLKFTLRDSCNGGRNT